jgi:biotin carboxyl carrier protein
VRLRFRHGDETHVVDLIRATDGRWEARVGGIGIGVDLPPGAHAGPARTLTVEAEGRSYRAVVARDGRSAWVAIDGEVVRLEETDDDDPPTARGHAAGEGLVTAPMPGKVVRVLVAEGDTVAAGQTLATLEAMKMETALAAPRSGRVARVCVVPGERVEPGQPVVEIGDPAP